MLRIASLTKLGGGSSTVDGFGLSTVVAVVAVVAVGSVLITLIKIGQIDGRIYGGCYRQHDRSRGRSLQNPPHQPHSAKARFQRQADFPDADTLE